MSFFNRVKQSKNSNSQVDKLKNEYFSCNKGVEDKEYSEKEFKTERYK